MESNRREFIKQCAFQKFCNTVLHNEACDAHRELHRHKAREITFSDLTLEEARQLHTFDEYFKGETAFERAGKKITPKLLLEAIRTLPEEKRKAVLLYYFEGMNDTEIAELFDTSRSTIQYRRTSSFELLKNIWISSHCGSDKGRPGRYEDCLAAFQRLHSPPLHAEAVRRARERLFWRRPRHSGTAASKTDDGCPHL